MMRAARAATEADHLAEQPQGAEGPAAVAAAVEPMVAPVAAPVSAVGAFAHGVVVFGLPSPEAELELGKFASVLQVASLTKLRKLKAAAGWLLASRHYKITHCALNFTP